MKKLVKLIFIIVLAYGCNNTKEEVKLDLINGSLNQTSIKSILTVCETPKSEYYEDRENGRNTYAKCDDETLLKLNQALNGEEGKGIGRPGTADLINGEQTFQAITTLSFILNNSSWFGEDDEIYRGEITAGISKNSTPIQIKQLFGKENHSSYRNNDWYLKYENSVINDVIVIFGFNIDTEIDLGNDIKGRKSLKEEIRNGKYKNLNLAYILFEPIVK